MGKRNRSPTLKKEIPKKSLFQIIPASKHNSIFLERENLLIKGGIKKEEAYREVDKIKKKWEEWYIQNKNRFKQT